MIRIDCIYSLLPGELAIKYHQEKGLKISRCSEHRSAYHASLFGFLRCPQTLDYGNRTISLPEIGEKGDRLEVRVVRMALAHYLLSRILKKKD